MKGAITGIGTATPPLFLTQEKACAFLSLGIGASKREERIWKRLYHKSGIRKRHSVLLEESEPERPPLLMLSGEEVTTQQRMELFEREAPKLTLQAAREALSSARKTPSAVTHLITVTCTGFFAPGLESILYSKLPLNPNTKRYQLGFMGCHAGLNALQLASTIIQAEQNASVLVVMCELCSLHFSKSKNRDQQISNMLFSDGAAAVIVEQNSDGASLSYCMSRRIPETEKLLEWRIGSNGFLMGLSKELPAVLRGKVRGALESGLVEQGVSLEEIEHFAIHPGGPQVVASVGAALGLDAAKLSPSLQVLKDYGNMSSPTLFFILKRFMLERTNGKLLMLGLGPGITVEAQLLQLRG